MSYTSYKDLIVWQKAMDLTDETYRLVKKLPKDELYALSAQMRRAAYQFLQTLPRDTEGSQKENLHSIYRWQTGL